MRVGSGRADPGPTYFWPVAPQKYSRASPTASGPTRPVDSVGGTKNNQLCRLAPSAPDLLCSKYRNGVLAKGNGVSQAPNDTRKIPTPVGYVSLKNTSKSLDRRNIGLNYILYSLFSESSSRLAPRTFPSLKVIRQSPVQRDCQGRVHRAPLTPAVALGEIRQRRVHCVPSSPAVAQPLALLEWHRYRRRV